MSRLREIMEAIPVTEQIPPFIVWSADFMDKTPTGPRGGMRSQGESRVDFRSAVSTYLDLPQGSDKVHIVTPAKILNGQNQQIWPRE